MREKILTFIEKNSRINLKELAIMLGVDEASVANEIAAMEQENVICGYHTLIDWDKAGLEKVTAMIEVRVTPQRGMGFDKIAERIYNYPEVKSVYLISGGFDLMVTLEGKTLREVSQFVTDKLSTLDQVLSTKTNFILKKYKDWDPENPEGPCFPIPSNQKMNEFLKEIATLCRVNKRLTVHVARHIKLSLSLKLNSLQRFISC